MIESIPSLLPCLAEIFILIMVVLALLAEIFIPQKNSWVTFLLTQLALLGALVITLYLYTQPAMQTFYGMYIHDALGCLLKLVIYLTSFFAFLYARHYIRQRHMAMGEYYILGLISVFGMMVLVSANDLLILFLGLEILSLPLYAMVALWRGNAKASEAAMKYYVMGAMATGILLYGISLLYGLSGSLNLQYLASHISTVTAHTMTFYFALTFIITGVAFKLGAAPFHMWAPDVYEGAPTPVTLFIGSAPKIAALGLALRLLVDAMPGLYLQWQQLLIIVALLSMGIGNIVAIVQSNIKRMLAYSSIAHMGYMSLGLLAATPEGYSATVFYIIIYALMSMGAFAVVIMLSHRGFEGDHIDDLRGLNTRDPWLAFMMLVLMFSMAGIPPTAGFFAKLGVLQALVNAHLVWLAAVALIFAVIGSYYYLAIVKVMYFEEPRVTTPIINSRDLRIAISINSLAILALGLFPTQLIDLCRVIFINP